jgi:hypothetical protein
MTPEQKKLNRICKAISGLTDEDLKCVELMAREQIAYLHPFKMATASKINDAGRHNLHVLRNLRRVRNTIKKFKQP